MKCKFEHDGDCCNSGAKQYMCKCQKRCDAIIPMTNAQKIRAMSDGELAKFLAHINQTNCQDCAFSHGWRCQPDRDDYSDFEKCEEGRKRWLQQPSK